MKYSILIMTLCISLLAHIAYGLEGKVVSITDGDTIKVLTNEKHMYKVRLYGIDAPEAKQPYGNVSKKYLSDMIAGKIVEVTEVGKDLYGRIIGRVYCDGQSVNADMVWSGMAWHYKDYAPKDKELLEAQRSARALSKGLWADPNPIAPWVFRKKK